MGVIETWKMGQNVESEILTKAGYAGYVQESFVFGSLALSLFPNLIFNFIKIIHGHSLKLQVFYILQVL